MLNKLISDCSLCTMRREGMNRGEEIKIRKNVKEHFPSLPLIWLNL